MELYVIPFAAAGGVLSHALYFNRGEHHMFGVLYVKLALAFLTAGTVVPLVWPDVVPWSPAQVFPVTAAYLTGLYLSLVVYRTILHPLRAFPGPPGARWTSLWLSSQLARSDGHKKILALHQKYGDFVRVGSSDLSIIHPGGVQAVYGPSSKCVKGSWYDLTHPMVSLQTTRDRDLHRARRRVWSDAFSDKALRGYEERIRGYRAGLMGHIGASAEDGTVVDVTKWFNFFTFDVMGDLAFGSSFGMLESEDQHWALDVLRRGMAPLSFHFSTWFFRLFTGVPGLSKDWLRFIKYCCERLDGRISSASRAKSDQPDIMSTLLKPWEGRPIPNEGRKLLEGDSQLIIVAGSDTTSVTLTHLVYELVKNPSYIDQLRQELAPHVKEGRVDFASIQTLPVLNGLIFETLRLHPPVPTVLARRTPPEGIQVGDVHVPGNMTVWCSQYAMGRSLISRKHLPGCKLFQAREVDSRPDMIADKSAFAPFSAGPASCIGRYLAIQNIRNTLSELITDFDLHRGVSDDFDHLEENTEDHFTLGLPALRLRFTKRS